jgi:hypothetical protein
LVARHLIGIGLHISEEKTMKPVKNLLFAALLVCSMTLTALAGDIDTPGYTTPSPERYTTVDSTNEDPSAPNSGSKTTVTYSETDNLLYDALTMFYSIF